MCACEPGFTCTRCVDTPGDWRYHAFPDDVDPFSKARQLARGQRRYRRKVASAKEWQKIVAAKIGPCRICIAPASNGGGLHRVEFHHVVAREDDGDDIADNIVPLCPTCHDHVTRRKGGPCRALLRSLRPAEYDYMVARGGLDYSRRAYGIEYTR